MGFAAVHVKHRSKHVTLLLHILLWILYELFNKKYENEKQVPEFLVAALSPTSVAFCDDLVSF